MAIAVICRVLFIFTRFWHPDLTTDLWSCHSALIYRWGIWVIEGCDSYPAAYGFLYFFSSVTVVRCYMKDENCFYFSFLLTVLGLKLRASCLLGRGTLLLEPLHQLTFLFFGFFLVRLEFELRTSHLQSRHSTTWGTLPVHFTVVILEMGSWEPFAQTGLESWSSRSQPSK
jgi:hypothetical protein